MKTTSVALFLALSAGYLGVANAESLHTNPLRAANTQLPCNHDADVDTEANKVSRTAVANKQPA